MHLTSIYPIGQIGCSKWPLSSTETLECTGVLEPDPTTITPAPMGPPMVVGPLMVGGPHMAAATTRQRQSTWRCWPK